MITIVKYPIDMEKGEEQIAGLISVMYHITEDPNKVVREEWIVDNCFIVQNEYADRVDKILMSFNYAVAYREDPYLKTICEFRLKMKENIRLLVKKGKRK